MLLRLQAGRSHGEHALAQAGRAASLKAPRSGRPRGTVGCWGGSRLRRVVRCRIRGRRSSISPLTRSCRGWRCPPGRLGPPKSSVSKRRPTVGHYRTLLWPTWNHQDRRVVRVCGWQAPATTTSVIDATRDGTVDELAVVRPVSEMEATPRPAPVAARPACHLPSRTRPPTPHRRPRRLCSSPSTVATLQTIC